MRGAGLLMLAALAGGCVEPAGAARGAKAELAAAEALIDAFYAFDAERLRAAMANAPAAVPQILFYQGWAEGANYVVLERKPCRFEEAGAIACDVKVRDDLIAALGTGRDVTDTFHISLQDGRIVGVRTSSDDPPEFEQALKWLGRERPELMEGPCRGFFAGGPTPKDCARAAVRGFADFAARPRG